MTKTSFLEAYRAALVAAYPWATDETRLDKFMASVRDTINGKSNSWDHNATLARRIWSDSNFCRYSLKALRELPG